ncbi:hypothetical protein EJ110_NYTH06111 [Nymphaea thermarum]|nr:hypothetical protein EJ110_NYTH06111 [Nymphaea thermarum]
MASSTSPADFLSRIVKGKPTKRPTASSASSADFSYYSKDRGGARISFRDGPNNLTSNLGRQGWPKPDAADVLSKQGPYECKTCGRCFRSFQALGGHRGSHKKAKDGEEKEKQQGK